MSSKRAALTVAQRAGRLPSRRRYRADVRRRLYALVVGGILTGFTLLLLTGAYVNDGPVLVSLTDAHGLHAGDLFVIAGWVVAMAALLLLAREPGRVRTRPDGSRLAGASQPEP